MSKKQLGAAHVPDDQANRAIFQLRIRIFRLFAVGKITHRAGGRAALVTQAMGRRLGSLSGLDGWFGGLNRLGL